MTASKTRTATPKKPTRPKLGKPRDKADAEFLASLSPWARKLELLARPLRGKLTKAVNQK
jgi:hypothetical protein